MAIMAAHRIPYAATATTAYPQDLARKVRTAVAMKGGMRFLHLLSACPPGWKMPAEQAIEAMRRAVPATSSRSTRCATAVSTTITHWPNPEIPLEDYLTQQGRFAPLLDDGDMLEQVKRNVKEQWWFLVERHQQSMRKDRSPDGVLLH